MHTLTSTSVFNKVWIKSNERNYRFLTKCYDLIRVFVQSLQSDSRSSLFCHCISKPSYESHDLPEQIVVQQWKSLLSSFKVSYILPWEEFTGNSVILQKDDSEKRGVRNHASRSLSFIPGPWLLWTPLSSAEARWNVYFHRHIIAHTQNIISKNVTVL